MTEVNKPVRVRFAPSPTGHLHIGGARTALYNFLFARQTGGQFILRIEDTDQKRLVQGAEEEILSMLKWLGLMYDEGPDVGGKYGPYKQSLRRDLYKEYANKLIDNDQAYYCFCSPDRLEKIRQEQQRLRITPHYDGFCKQIDPDEAKNRVLAGEKHVIRLKTPKQGFTTVHDKLRGDITVENHTLDDIILVKSDGLALYHLAAMVDDHLMDISHVIRGSEWLPSLPYHTLIYKSFGWQQPEWVHLSVFLKPSGKGKMSKREAADLIKDGYSIFIKDLEQLGYIPEAILNWIVLMGWSLDDHTEFFTLSDMIEKFNIDRLNPSPAAINFTKFDHFNGLHIRNLSIPDLARRLKPFYINAGYEVDDSLLLRITPLIRERIVTLDDAPEISGFFFSNEIDIVTEDLIPKGLTKDISLSILAQSHEILSNAPDMKVETVEPLMRNYVESSGLSAGQVFGVLRICLTGQKVSPPLFESMEIIGKEMILKRIQKGIMQLETFNSPFSTPDNLR